MLLEHIERIRSGTSREFTLANIPDWICRHTKLRGEPFSFKDHEYQLKILTDQSPEKYTQKPSQVGITELTLREALAVIRILTGSTAIYTLPTANFVEKVVKTRVNSIISESEDLRFSVSKDVNSTEVKQFGESFIYFNGTFGQNQAISTPADMLIHDEVDFSNMEVLTSYESRTTHSKYKLRREFSTPTLPGRGINRRIQHSRQHMNFVKCGGCNEWFYPSYYDHVKVPGWDRPLEEITSANLNTVRWQEAQLHCPRCGCVPSLQPAYREWVVKNPTEQHIAAGFYVSPFDAPNIVSLPRQPGTYAPFLVEKSTKYERRADFVNFALGLTHEDAKESMTEGLLKSLHVVGEAPPMSGWCFGADMGLTCHILIGGVDSTGQMLVIHRERVPLGEFEKRKLELCRQYRVLVSVIDAFPYTDTVLRMQHADQNLFGGVYHSSKTLAIFSIQDRPEDDSEGKLPIKQAKINRNLAFDELNGVVVRRQATFLDDKHTATFISHLLDMKRTQSVNKQGEVENIWVKSEQGEDHFFHALMYLYTAIRLRGTVTATVPNLAALSTFKLRNPV